jgi:hypothetical protein
MAQSVRSPPSPKYANAQQVLQGCDQGLTQIGLDQRQQFVLALKMELRQARVRQYS